ncbi:MAG TPA: ribose-5-phosphate isomerase RpiA [Candidatus Lokiarchaeia archaeon]|nr:ribose-5-phosphate isomerase RpiA [Candidatus Lokiarchaeia archaeon]
MTIDLAKKTAGYAAVDNHVTKSGIKVGIGSGSTITFSVERISEKLKKGEIKNIMTVCTSYQSTLLCRQHKIPVTTLDDPAIDGELDVAIDGADEFDEKLNLIKGGGGAHTQEKIVDSAAKIFVVVADEKKQSQKLGEKFFVPVEFIPSSLAIVKKQLEAMGATPELRMGVKKAGPVITDNGNFIIDANFGVIEDPTMLEHEINGIVGVVENGIFANMASIIYMGRSDGSLEIIERQE